MAKPSLGPRLFALYERTPRGWVLIIGAVLGWVAVALLVIGLSAIPRAFSAPTCIDLAGKAAYQPPPCPGSVCQLYGPSGCIRDWQLHVQLANLAGKSIRVPAKVCGSACVIALGLAYELGMKVSISPRARIVWGHSAAKLAPFPMPDWLRRRALTTLL